MWALAEVDGGGQPLLPNASLDGPPRGGPLPGTSGDYYRPGGPDTGDQIPVDEGRGPSRWDSCRVQDLERDLEATCHALSSEQEERGMQEVLRAQADLRRAETALSAMRRDHATVSGEVVRQRSRTRFLEEGGSHLRRLLANAQRAARDVAGVVDERLNRHLPAILEAAEIVRDERVSQPMVEQALRVREGYGPPSAANPNFTEICATLVCTAVLRVEPPPSLETLSRRLRVTAQPILRFPTEASSSSSYKLLLPMWASC